MHIEDLASRLQKYFEIGMNLSLSFRPRNDHNETAFLTSVHILIVSLLRLKANG